MALDYIELGPVPAGETCAQFGTEHYMTKSLRECKVYQHMLERLCPIPQGLPVAFVVRSHAHDFGPYREVSVRFCGSNPAAVDFAHHVDANAPDQWDAIARDELACNARVAEFLAGHPLPEPH